MHPYSTSVLSRILVIRRKQPGRLEQQLDSTTIPIPPTASLAVAYRSTESLRSTSRDFNSSGPDLSDRAHSTSPVYPYPASGPAATLRLAAWCEVCDACRSEPSTFHLILILPYPLFKPSASHCLPTNRPWVSHPHTTLTLPASLVCTKSSPPCPVRRQPSTALSISIFRPSPAWFCGPLIIRTASPHQ